uniref:Uncharacterized protein n=1 Tax=Meloidogyne enterolobii TaxID=390850 RepID=A0A6V7UNR1_MELEN|nr:unnamed protein product [Meloidogyne enterolobii]
MFLNFEISFFKFSFSFFFFSRHFRADSLTFSLLFWKNERDVEVNDNAEKGEDTPIQSSHNVEGNNNAEGTSFVNPQTDDCVNNLSDTNACPSGQPNVQSSVGLHTQQMDDHDDLIDLSLLDDSNFLDYLNSFDNS